MKIAKAVWQYIRLPLLVGVHTGLSVAIADGLLEDVLNTTLTQEAAVAAVGAGLMVVVQELGRVITMLQSTTPTPPISPSQ